MQQAATRVVTLFAVVVLTVAGAGLARASVDELAGLRLTPSAIPSLLGPIDGHGRAGWECAPEQAARATEAAHAELPSPDR